MLLSDTIKFFDRKKAYFISALFVSSILPVIGILKKYLFFQNNDDLFILGRVSGIFYENPTDELIYISPPLSWLIKNLYVLNGNYAWYTLVLLLTQYLAVVTYFLLFEKKINSLNKVNAFILYLFVSLPIFVFFIVFYSLQFTQTGIIAAGIGTLAFFLSNNNPTKYLGLFLVSLGILWRSDGSVVIILFVSTIYWLSYYLLVKRIKIVKTFSISLPLIIVLFFSYGLYVASFNTWAPWINEEKKSYVELKNVFTQLYGFESTDSSYSDLEKPAKQAGFSDNDWALYQKYYFLDSDIFGISVQQDIAKNRFQVSYPVFMKLTLEKLIDLFSSRYKNELVTTALLLLISLFFLQINRLLIFFGFTFLLFFGYYSILLLGERLPERVFWPFTLVALASFIAITVTNSEFKVTGKFSINTLSSVVLILLFITSFNNLFKYHQSKIDKDLWWKVAPAQKILNIDQIYFYEPDKPVVAFFSFYENFRKTMDPLTGPNQLPPIWNQLILIGWENKTPEFNKRLINYGLSEDLFTSIARGDAYLATWSNLSDNFEVNNTSIFLREHKGIEVYWEESPFVFSDSGLAIWRTKESKELS